MLVLEAKVFFTSTAALINLYYRQLIYAAIPNSHINKRIVNGEVKFVRLKTYTDENFRHTGKDRD